MCSFDCFKSAPIFSCFKMANTVVMS
uniref:Uncharacterized protein n=1 Tax=Anguilla anguilla TaxID=7936 RepID=A0A0E9R2K9_ANGAN